MSRHQLTHQSDQSTDDKGQETRGGFDLPATAIVRQMLSNGNADVRAIARIVASNPRASHEIFMLLNKTVGQAFANEVLMFATQKDATSSSGLGAGRDIVSFDQSSEYQESRATIDHPHTVTDAVDDGGYREDRATIDHPRAPVEAEDPGGGYREDRATIDHPHAEKKEAPWVERARTFNRAHADNVRAFLDSTGTRCIDEATGELDPNKVARWQKEKGLPPDGRIGEQTVRAAVTDPSTAL